MHVRKRRGAEEQMGAAAALKGIAAVRRQQSDRDGAQAELPVDDVYMSTSEDTRSARDADALQQVATMSCGSDDGCCDTYFAVPVAWPCISGLLEKGPRIVRELQEQDEMCGGWLE